MNKKLTSGSAAKSGGTGLYGKSSKDNSKSSSGKSGSLGKSLSPGKSSVSTGKSAGLLTGKTSNSSGEPKKQYLSPSSYATPKSGKSSTSFGIIWIPTRRNKQKKDIVYNAHRDDRHRDRSPTMYNFMSGDSHDNQPHKKKEEEAGLLHADRIKGPIATAASAGTGVVAANSLKPGADGSLAEIPELHDSAKVDSKDAGGDNNEDDEDSDYLEHNDTASDGSNNRKGDKQVFGDKVDSVYLRPPPPHKVRSSTTSAPEEEDCGVKCLYYTLQCCDCVLM